MEDVLELLTAFGQGNAHATFFAGFQHFSQDCHRERGTSALPCL